MPATTQSAPRVGNSTGWEQWVRRILLFAVLWLVLTGGAPDSWLVGAPAVLLAAWLSLTLWAESPISLRGLARFIPWFLFQSFVGAADVAWRAVQPRMPLYPGVVHQRLRLPPGASRVMLADVVSMLPGTLSADLEGDELAIHALDVRKDLRAMVRDLEPRIAAIFHLQLAPESSGGSRS